MFGIGWWKGSAKLYTYCNIRCYGLEFGGIRLGPFFMAW